MKNTSKSRQGMMGKLHNALVELIDNSQLTPPEAVMVLRLLGEDIEAAFRLSLRRK